ncbi:hypothetical protein GC170_12275 [bacterium]|nr:hypothetical protein [bacterium]
MSNGIRLPLLAIAVVVLASLAPNAQADVRADLLRQLKPDHDRLRAAAREVLIRGEFRNVVARSAYEFRTLAATNGERVVHRQIDPNSESGFTGASVAILRTSGATLLTSNSDGSEPTGHRIRPDGMGSYDRILSGTRHERLAADACWSVHGIDVVTLLEDPRIEIRDLERIEENGVSIVRVRFDAGSATHHFDRGELHFRPDMMWSLTRVVLDFPFNPVTGPEHFESWSIRPRLWPDGTVFPAEVEKSVEFLNRHDQERTHVSFLERSAEFDRTRLFEIDHWTQILAVAAPAPIESGTEDDISPLPSPVLVRLEKSRAPSPMAAQVMKFASPASGMITVLLAASLFDRLRRRARL